jgi:hypothetical protein
MARVGIAIDKWKLPIFERRLKQGNYRYENAGKLTHNTILLRVITDNVTALQCVVEESNKEAAQTGAPQ